MAVGVVVDPSSVSFTKNVLHAELVRHVERVLRVSSVDRSNFFELYVLRRTKFGRSVELFRVVTDDVSNFTSVELFRHVELVLLQKTFYTPNFSLRVEQSSVDRSNFFECYVLSNFRYHLSNFMS